MLLQLVKNLKIQKMLVKENVGKMEKIMGHYPILMVGFKCPKTDVVY